MGALYYKDGTHTYFDVGRGRVVPNITDMLEQTGWVNPRFYTVGSAERGEAVHRLLADYDLGLLDVASCVSAYRAYLLSYINVAHIVRPTWRHIEEPFLHEELGFAGRPDRVGDLFGAVAVVDIKSGARERSHPIQTALQAILVAPVVQVPARAIPRFGWYVKANGLSRLVQFIDRHDFDEADRVIRTCCGG